MINVIQSIWGKNIGMFTCSFWNNIQLLAFGLYYSAGVILRHKRQIFRAFSNFTSRSSLWQNPYVQNSKLNLIKQLPFPSFSWTLSFRFIFCFAVHFHYIRLYIFFIILCSFIIFSGCFTRGDSEEVLYPFLPFRCGLRTERQSWWGPFLFTCQRK